MLKRFKKTKTEIFKIHLDPNNPRFGRKVAVDENRYLEESILSVLPNFLLFDP